jgi:choline dehydrogenase-like flavoprotein
MPVARIASHLAPSDIARLRFMAKKSHELLAASGVNRIFESYSSWDWFGATHVFGTCRMGNDPARSVVDAVGRSHRWRNLWITDASVFPSSGGGEAPSLTIQALALRTAERADF